MASKTIGKVSKDIGALGKMSRTAGAGLRSLGANLAKVGAIAAVGIGAAVKSGLDSLAELESATSSAQGALERMGVAGQISGSQVATWANDLEASVQAAFDDKAIVRGTASLIRYGKVAPVNLQRAMRVMTDLAARTGDVESAAQLLGKALADPAKAAGKLAKSGVVLTAAQQKQLGAFIEVNDAAGAQEYLLRQLEKTTAGAARALHGPYADAQHEVADATEDAQKALAEGFIPVIERVSAKLRTAIADPKVMAGIREFGQTLAGGLDSLLSIAEKLPWGTIGESMKIAGAGAKTLLDAFTTLPPWVQTAVITGWGLNKLTGGALSGIVGELGKGLIKGVLGMNAGVVNINAGVVNGPGGVPGPVAKGVGAAAIGTVLSAASIAVIGAAALNFFLRAIPEAVNAGKPVTVGERNPFTGKWTGTGPGGTPTPPALGGSAFLTTVSTAIRDGIAAATKKPGGLTAVAEAGSAGVMDRAIAKGFKPTASGITATMARNAIVQATIDRGRAAAAVAAYREGADRIVRAIQGIVIPSAQVVFTARDQLLSENKRDAYGPTTKIGGAR